MEVSWSMMWNVTDETPKNCERYLDKKGMELFLRCLQVRRKTYVLRKCMGSSQNCPCFHATETALVVWDFVFMDGFMFGMLEKSWHFQFSRVPDVTMMRRRCSSTVLNCVYDHFRVRMYVFGEHVLLFRARVISPENCGIFCFPELLMSQDVVKRICLLSHTLHISGTKTHGLISIVAGPTISISRLLMLRGQPR